MSKRSDAEQVVKKVKIFDSEFNTDSVWETDNEFVLISDEISIPPYIVSKNNEKIRQVIWGNKKDMDIAYKKSTFVMKVM